MNREKRRALQKKLQGKKAYTLADVLKTLGNESNSMIQDGDLVTLNVGQITGRKDYPRMQEGYRKFVETSREKVFVARPHHARPGGFSATFELEGVENWIFWEGDLIPAKDIQAEVVE